MFLNFRIALHPPEDLTDLQTFYTYKLTFDQFKYIFNHDGKRRVTKKSEANAILEDLSTSRILRAPPDPTLSGKKRVSGYTTWLSSVIPFWHFDEDDICQFSRDPQTNRVLANHSDMNKIYYHLSDGLMDFRNAHTNRVINIILAHRTAPWRDIDVVIPLDMFMFFIWREDSYSRVANIKRKILEPVVRDMNEVFRPMDNMAYELGDIEGKRHIRFTGEFLKEELNAPAHGDDSAFAPPFSLDEVCTKNPVKYVSVVPEGAVAVTDRLEALNRAGILKDQIDINAQFREILKQCSTDEAYRNQVLDTIGRVEEKAKTEPWKFNGGYLLSAITKDYFHAERAKETKIKTANAAARAKQEEQTQIEHLVTEGTKAFHARREPELKKLRAMYMSDDLVEKALTEVWGSYASKKAIARWYEGGKKIGESTQSAIDTYLANHYLDPIYRDCDGYLEREYGLVKKGATYVRKP